MQGKQTGPRVNKAITAPEVRVVGHDGEMLGVLSTRDALQKAAEVSLDLVEVSPNAAPPVCKILDYGKFKYEQQKKKNEAKKKQKVVEVKEVQLRPGIDTHDLQVKCRNIQKFIEQGNKVKIAMRFRGREMAHQDIGLNLLKRIVEDFKDVVKVDKKPSLEGRQMIMILSPAKAS